MREWKECLLKDVCIGVGSYGIGASAVPKDDGKFTYLRITDIKDDGSLNYDNLMSVDDENAYKYILSPNDIVFARTGNSTGRSYFYDGSDGVLVYAGFLIKFSLNPDKVNPKYLKYYTHSKDYFDWVASFDTGATRGNINAKTYSDMPLLLPPRHIQDMTVSILSSLDEKIETNRRINARLEELAQGLFKSWFIDFEPFGGKMPEDWKTKSADQFFSIDIGKTPPRKENQWFSLTPKDHIWVSISDMGKSGMFISSSSEMLTDAAVNKFNVIIVPKDTVLLSFKLTIGRVCIANRELTTNEAIARFRLNHPIEREYLYSYLKRYDFNLLGSTSSIATAVNSKIIRGMPIMMPSKEVLKEFSKVVSPMFDRIEMNSKESARLATLRDALLPKLMSGEINVK